MDGCEELMSLSFGVCSVLTAERLRSCWKARISSSSPSAAPSSFLWHVASSSLPPPSRSGPSQRTGPAAGCRHRPPATRERLEVRMGRWRESLKVLTFMWRTKEWRQHRAWVPKPTCVLLPWLLRSERVDLMDCVVELPLIWWLCEPLDMDGPS